MAKRKSAALVRMPVKVVDPAVPEAPGGLQAFERLARDPRLTVEKLGELIALQERIIDRNAKAAFEASFQAMQPTLPRISRRGAIKNREGKVQSRYARYEDIRAVVDPILQRYRFEFHTRTEWPETGTLEVVGVLTHRDGHSRESRFRTKADDSGGKNYIQGLGSGVQYGRRYTLRDLLAIVDEGVDDDGQAWGKANPPAPTPPAKTESRQRDTPPPPPVITPTVVETPRRTGKVITQPMRQRLQMIVKNSGRNIADVKTWLKRRYGIDSSADLPQDCYEEVCKAIEHPASLPDREPGEE